LALKPTPGTLSNGAASGASARLYAVGLTFTSGGGPTHVICARTLSGSGAAEAVVIVRPMAIGSDHPAAS